MTTPNTQSEALREALEKTLEAIKETAKWDGPTDWSYMISYIESALSQPPAPEQASGELVASADCPLCGKDTPHGHGTEDIAEWLRIQARRFVGANADDLIRINTSEVHLIDSLRRQIQELEHRVESLTPETSYENYGKSDAELKALFATTKEEATHNGIEFLMHGKNMAFKIGNQMFAMAHEPDEPGDFEFMKGALLHALTTITPDVKTAVDRFLGWKLPQDFSPDCGISFTPLRHPNGWPTGTNLFTADQARRMFEHVLAASPAAPEAAKPVKWAQCPETDSPCSVCPTAGIPCEAAKPEPLQKLTRLSEEMGLYPWQQAQEEPEVVAEFFMNPHAYELSKLPRKAGDAFEVVKYDVGDGVPLITLQSHREAVQDQTIWYEKTIDAHREAIAKKDATEQELRQALQACVDALKSAKSAIKGREHTGFIDAAITKAKGAL